MTYNIQGKLDIKYKLCTKGIWSRYNCTRNSTKFTCVK